VKVGGGRGTVKSIPVRFVVAVVTRVFAEAALETPGYSVGDSAKPAAT
jgi:hypothetical protein